MEESKKGKGTIFYIIGLISGIILIIIGIIFLLKYSNATFYYGGISHLNKAEFGADFYTEIYKSTAFTGNAIKNMYEVINSYLSVFFIFIGIIDICLFGIKLHNK